MPSGRWGEKIHSSVVGAAAESVGAPTPRAKPFRQHSWVLPMSIGGASLHPGTLTVLPTFMGLRGVLQALNIGSGLA